MFLVVSQIFIKQLFETSLFFEFSSEVFPLQTTATIAISCRYFQTAVLATKSEQPAGSSAGQWCRYSDCQCHSICICVILILKYFSCCVASWTKEHYKSFSALLISCTLRLEGHPAITPLHSPTNPPTQLNQTLLSVLSGRQQRKPEEFLLYTIPWLSKPASFIRHKWMRMSIWSKKRK